MGDYNDYLELASVPTSEHGVCINVNVDYMPKMQKEANHMVALLKKRFPDLNGDFRTVKKKFLPFCDYMQIQFCYKDDDAGIKETEFVQANFPHTWSDSHPVLMYAGSEA